MSVRYQTVGWNRNKLVYDAVLIVAIVAYILVFLRVAPAFQDVTRPLDGAIIRMRAFGTCAFVLLTAILCIGPLARLDARFLPLLYNRRHFGVLTCGVAVLHADHVLGWYMAFSPIDPYVALLASNTSYGQVLGFPFETVGIVALLILVVMAVTSHDFWLSFLTPPLWKAIHMGVYGAYGLIVVHVALGYLQTEKTPVFTIVVAFSVASVASLHLAAGLKERRLDRAGSPRDATSGLIDAGPVDDIEDDRAKIVALPSGERVAVFRYDGKLSAISNLCAHQNGPLGEGRILDGCVTCPWHGFQYRPEDGCAPAPFTEKVATYNLTLDGTRILLDPVANPPGTRVEPVRIDTAAAS